MGHNHHAHGSGDATAAHGHGDERAIAIAALLAGGFMAAEVIGGLVSGSLALLADAAHMLTDFVSLALAWLAFRFARLPATRRRTYGFDRLSVLVAFVNGLSLFVIAAWIVVQAYQRLVEPYSVLGELMLWVALAGLVVNVLAFWILNRNEGENLNVRAAALHVAGDLLGSVAVIVAAVVILWTGWTPIDPILSVLVAAIILRPAWKIVRESGHILLEGAPESFDAREVAADLTGNIRGLARVHHIHAWSITQERPMATLEAEVSPGTDLQATRRAIKARLAQHFGVAHVTVEVYETGAESKTLPG